MAITDISSDSIRNHYDKCSGLYEKLWGPHIHHGLWSGGESVADAQIRLIERLAKAAGVPQGADVLDAGCGLGGSSLWLAREKNCRVTGVTLSPVQARRATARMEAAGVSARVRILRADLEKWEPETASFDVVWSIE